jgi:predicted O-methyltransferase YrrM
LKISATQLFEREKTIPTAAFLLNPFLYLRWRLKMMQHLFKSYFKFIWNSTNAHGVHSPFVFNLVRNCFYDAYQYPEYRVLKQYRNALLKNKNSIEVTDFGAGSRVFKSNTRTISDIAKNAGISSKRAQLLFRIVRYFQPKNVLEIGTSLGLATSALALPNISQITTLEGCPNTMKQCYLQLQKFNINNVTCVNTEFSAYLKTATATQSGQLTFFDGNHSQKATLEYFENLLPTTTNESVWIFDDIHWSKDMEQAWEIIKKHPKVTVTIDTFQWGIVFFRTEQVKENFVIRTQKSFFFDIVLGIKKGWGLLH